MQMTDIDYANIVGPMPTFITVDLYGQLSRLNSLRAFDHLYPNSVQRVDGIVSRIIDAIADKQFINKNIAELSRSQMSQVMAALENAVLGSSEMTSQDMSTMMRFHGIGTDVRIAVMDDMVTFEQTALDIAHALEGLKLYRFNRFLPYVYETTLNPRAVLLTKIDNFEFLCDHIPTLCMYPFMEPD